MFQNRNTGNQVKALINNKKTKQNKTKIKQKHV